EVVQAVQRQNSDLPRGILDGKYQAFTLLASGQLNRAKDYRPMIVASRDGSPVRLQDIGRVIDGVEQNKNAGSVRYFSDKDPAAEHERTIFVSVKRQPGANTLDLIKAAKKVLAQTQQQLPGAVEVKVIYDQAELIGESVSDVKFTLVLAVALVVMVIFLFLRS